MEPALINLFIKSYSFLLIYVYTFMIYLHIIILIIVVRKWHSIGIPNVIAVADQHIEF